MKKKNPIEIRKVIYFEDNDFSKDKTVGGGAYTHHENDLDRTGDPFFGVHPLFPKTNLSFRLCRTTRGDK